MISLGKAHHGIFWDWRSTAETLGGRVIMWRGRNPESDDGNREKRVCRKNRNLVIYSHDRVAG
jgi:hypothetical protein